MSIPVAFASPISLPRLPHNRSSLSKQITPTRPFKATLAADSYFQYRHPNKPHQSNFNLPRPQPSLNPPSRPIHLLASDLDGTLLNPSKRIEPANVKAVISLIKAGFTFVPATGKSRVGAIRAMGPLATFMQQHAGGPSKFPGIYLNGLLVCGNQGQVIFERGLQPQEALVVLQEGEKRGLTVLFYSGDRVLVRKRTMHTDMFIVSHEPVPEAVPSLETAIEETFIHKALLVDPMGRVRDWREELEVELADVGIITQARPDVLEVLPRGGNKGDGLRMLLKHLGIGSEFVMAIGDGENDLEMIREAGLGVAVANSVPELILAADEVVCANSESAVAYAIGKFIEIDN